MSMEQKYLMGIDLGTSSTKAALYQIDGKLMAEASAEVPLFYPKPGSRIVAMSFCEPRSW